MNNTHKHIFIVAAAAFLFVLSFFIDKNTLGISKTNKIDAKIVQTISILNPSEKYISLVKNQDSLEQQTLTLLKEQGKKHHLKIVSISNQGLKNIEINLKADLDVDVFNYLKSINQEFKGSITFKEIGLFRDNNHVTGKIILTRILGGTND